MNNSIEQQICDKMNELYCSCEREEVGILDIILNEINWSEDENEEENEEEEQ